MVVLQGRLEGVSLRVAAGGAGLIILLHGAVSTVVLHKSIVFLSVLLAAPDSPGHQKENTHNNGTSNTNHDANDSVASLSRHARVARGVAPVESRGRCSSGSSCHRLHKTVAVGSSHNVDKCGGDGSVGGLCILVVLLLRSACRLRGRSRLGSTAGFILGSRCRLGWFVALAGAGRCRLGSGRILGGRRL